MKIKNFVVFATALVVLALGVWACSKYDGREPVKLVSTTSNQLSGSDTVWTPLLNLSDFANQGVLTSAQPPLYAPEVVGLGYTVYNWTPNIGTT